MPAMASSLCWFCGKVKGKRACPARGGELICSRCCGSKRRIEIRCPEDCVYLHGADARWSSETQQKEEARFLVRFLELPEPIAMFALFLHHLILAKAKPIAALDDAEIEQVVEAATKTFETRARGVLYSHSTSAPHLQPLSDWLVNVVAAREGVSGAPPASDEEALAALKTTLEAVRGHTEKGPARERYMDVVERTLRETFANAPAVEIPEELALSGKPTNLIVPP